MTVLVIAEHDQHSLKPSTFNVITAALACGDKVDVLVAGHQCQAAARAAAGIAGVSQVLLADASHLAAGLAEDLALQVLAVAEPYTHILAPASAWGRNFLPRVAARLNVAQVSDVIAVHAPDTFERPIYAGNALATVRSLDAVKVMTVRPTAFAAALNGGAAAVVAIDAAAAAGRTEFVSRELVKSERPDLGSARAVVSGGRGMGSAENFALLEPLADRLHAAMGASRAAVDAGFVPNDWQVGQTGKIVAPDVYVAVGISGAIQHLAGMKDSKIIVAINKDPEAPIFSVADYGLVADLFEAVPQLVGLLETPA